MKETDPEKAADFLEAALFGGEDLLDQATVDLSVELPLVEGYKLLRLIGEGGFGMVYEAEQRVPIRRRVALKVLRPGNTTRELLARFEQERQVLALLSHPHIAKVFDAGETEDGRPFISMELVEGRTIDRYARGLEQREQVALMRDVSRAVGHAHHKGIIHRDLKPSNILITRVGGSAAEPRIIDFGIAKALDGPLSSKVMFTQIRQVVGTPGYLSPERQHTSQIRHGADTREDVFALGAILWELLTGETPRQQPQAGATRVILPNEKELPDELRWIARKATDPDAEQRYANADALADDLHRYLEGQPLVAASQSAIYVMAKWAKRNQPLAVVATISSVAVVTALFLVLQSLQRMRKALDETEASRAEMRTTFSHADYLMGMTRARGRPVHAMAQWSRAVTTDPTNRSALGMLLATWGQRSYPYGIAPVAPLPEGRVIELSVSPGGQWAAVLVEAESGVTSLVRCRQGEANGEVVEIPADGEMAWVAVADSGVTAVAGFEGPVGLLQADGSWLASAWEARRLLGLDVTPEDRFRLVDVDEVRWLNSKGSEAAAAVMLPAAAVRWNSSPGDDRAIIGMQGGRLAVLSEPGEAPQMVETPLRAPMTAVALSAEGSTVAAAWRNGEIWLRDGKGGQRRIQGQTAIDLRFSRDGSRLVTQDPYQVRLFNLATGSGAEVVELEHPLRSISEVEDGVWVLTQVHGADGADELPGFGTQIHAATSRKGGVLVVADSEHRSLEWLTFASGSGATARRKVEQGWLSMVPARSGTTHAGADEDGWVCEVHEAGGVVREWRYSEEPVRLAAVDRGRQTVLLDRVGSADVRVVRKDGSETRIDCGKPSALALSGNGGLVAVGLPSGVLRLFDGRTGEPIRSRNWQRGPVTAATFVSPDRIALAFSAQIRVWDWRSNTVLPSILDFGRPIACMAVDPSGSRLAAAGQGDLHVIDIRSGLRVVGALKTASDARAMCWETNGGCVWTFPRAGDAVGTRMPPMLEEAPTWLPAYVERHLGMRVNDRGRVVRSRSQEPLPDLPASADPALRAWLLRRL